MKMTIEYARELAKSIHHRYTQCGDEYTQRLHPSVGMVDEIESTIQQAQSEARSRGFREGIEGQDLHKIAETMIVALRQAEDSLGALRRCHGAEVTELCYPALNTVREAITLYMTDYWEKYYAHQEKQG